MPTQAERRAATSVALTRAARDLFGRRGFDAVSIDDIAAAASVTRGALYHHYRGKEAIFEVVFREVEEQLRDEVIRSATKHARPRDQLREGCLAFVTAAAKRGISRIALIDGPTVLGWSRYKAIDDEYFLELLVAATVALRPRASIADNTMVARALLAALCDLAIRAATNASDRPAVEAALGRLVDGV